MKAAGRFLLGASVLVGIAVSITSAALADRSVRDVVYSHTADLALFGDVQPSGSTVGLALPTKVVIDYDDVDYFQKYVSPDFKVEHLIIVINQIGPRKVSVFGYGHKK